MPLLSLFLIFPQLVDFQVVLIGDWTKTYVIYTYFCPSDHSPYHTDFIPHPISATIGVSIEDLFDREFRYSDTDYTVELRCINQITDSKFDYNWYNLYYDLTTDPIDMNTSMSPYIFSEFWTRSY